MLYTFLVHEFQLSEKKIAFNQLRNITQEKFKINITCHPGHMQGQITGAHQTMIVPGPCSTKFGMERLGLRF